jgi:hypothetical protein
MVPLDLNVTGTASPFTVAIYQANGGQLFWLNEDAKSMFLGPIEKETLFAGVAAVRGTLRKPEVNRQTRSHFPAALNRQPGHGWRRLPAPF